MWILTSQLCVLWLSFGVAHCQCFHKFGSKKCSSAVSLMFSQGVSSVQPVVHRKTENPKTECICSHDYHKSQAKVLWWYSEPLEIWQIHSLASPQHLSSVLSLPGGGVNNFVVASKGRGIDPGQRQEEMFEEDGSTWLTFKCYSWPDYDYEKCLTGERRFVSPTGQGDKKTADFPNGNLCQLMWHSLHVIPKSDFWIKNKFLFYMRSTKLSWWIITLPQHYTCCSLANIRLKSLYLY